MLYLNIILSGHLSGQDISRRPCLELPDPGRRSLREWWQLAGQSDHVPMALRCLGFSTLCVCQQGCHNVWLGGTGPARDGLGATGVVRAPRTFNLVLMGAGTSLGGGSLLRPGPGREAEGRPLPWLPWWLSSLSSPDLPSSSSSLVWCVDLRQIRLWESCLCSGTVAPL